MNLMEMKERIKSFFTDLFSPHLIWLWFHFLVNPFFVISRSRESSESSDRPTSKSFLSQFRLCSVRVNTSRMSNYARNCCAWGNEREKEKGHLANSSILPADDGRERREREGERESGFVARRSVAPHSLQGTIEENYPIICGPCFCLPKTFPLSHFTTPVVVILSS